MTFLRLTLILFLILILVSGVIFFQVMKLSKKECRKSAKSAAAFVSLLITPEEITTCRIWKEPNENTDKALPVYLKKTGIKRISVVYFTDLCGYYMYDTKGNSVAKDDRMDFEEILPVKKEQVISGKGTYSVFENGFLYYYTPLTRPDGELIAYTIITAKWLDNGEIVLIIVCLAAFSLIFSIIAGVLSVFVLNRKVFISIGNLSKWAKEVPTALADQKNISNEDFSDLFDMERKDEIGELGNTIRKTFMEIEKYSHNLNDAVYAATHDAMTEVYNKRFYEERISDYCPANCPTICVIYFDVNNLKLINDTEGHERGDFVIKAAAVYISSIIKSAKGLCFRMGGDEFLAVITKGNYSDYFEIINRIESDAPYTLSEEQDEVKCTLAYGYAYAKGSYSFDELLAEAEENMYQKKFEIKKKLNLPSR